MARNATRVILALLVAMVVLAQGYSLPVGAETYREPPVYTFKWMYIADKDAVIRDYAWSPQGDKLAIVVNYLLTRPKTMLLVYDKDGNLVWSTGEINGFSWSGVEWSSSGLLAFQFNKEGAVGPSVLRIIDVDSNTTVDISIEPRGFRWSPTGDLLAVAAGKSVYLFNKTGGMLWHVKVGETGGVLWSPDGRLIAVRSSVGGTLTLLSVDGSVLWSVEVTRALIDEYEWDVRGEYIALLTSDRTVYVYDKNGSLVWHNETIRAFDIEWSPSSQHLAVAGAKIWLVTPTGDQVWAFDWAEQYGFLPKYTIAWNPVDNRIAALVGETMHVIDAETGSEVWKGNVRFSSGSAAWNADGTRLAMASEVRIIMYGPAGGYGTIKITNCIDCAVIASDGILEGSYVAGKDDTITLYATPGNYTLTFRLIFIPLDYAWLISPDPLILDKYNVTVNLTVESGQAYTIKAPIDELMEMINSSLARILLKDGEPGSRVLVNDTRVKIGSEGYAIVYATPGTYTIKYGDTTKQVTVKAGDLIVISLSSLLQPTSPQQEPQEEPEATQPSQQEQQQEPETPASQTGPEQEEQQEQPQAQEQEQPGNETTQAGAGEEAGQEQGIDTKVVAGGIGLIILLLALLTILKK
ncbi:MAG: WD40 repeat domain-containing protein [Desulfurococcales archaeon]|nr:WD40 repeat domain-containing protein [Desulfurococcales archaeon]